MKTQNQQFYLPVIILLLFVSITLNAQDYITFPDSGAVWKETYWWQPSPYYYNGIGDTYIEGDTVFNDTVYKKILNLHRDVYCSEIIISGPSYYGGLREDTINQKVFLRGNVNSGEYLLYDYSLGVGDTLPEEMNWFCPYSGVYIDAIDTITTSDDVKRRVWHLDFEDPYPGWPQIIEGIGTTSGLLGGIEPLWEGWNELLCFSVNGEDVWKSWRDTCYVVTDSCVSVGINALAQINTDIRLFPNPVHTSTILNVKIDQINTMTNFLGIYDLYGNEVLFIEFHSDSFELKSPSVKGVYIVKIFVNNEFLNFKLIVNN